MNLVRYTALLVLMIVLLSGVVAAANTTPADLGKDITGVLSENPPEFVVIQADKKPSVTVNGHKGYRVVLRQELRESHLPQQIGAVQDEEPVQTAGVLDTKVSHIDLVLFPDTDKVTSTLKDRIPWQDLAQQYFVKPVYMGKGRGYHWFAKTTIFWQDEVRRKMKLIGGDDRVALAIEGLEIKDEGSTTRSLVCNNFIDLGDAVIPALQVAIRKHEKDDPNHYIYVLGDIETDKSTEALRAFYRSKAPEVSRAAASVLAGFGTRPAARAEYIDMLHRRFETASVARKCAKFGWTEAVPDLEAIMASPASWWEFESAFVAHRALTGRTIDNIAERANDFVWQGKEGDDASTALLNMDDKEAAAVLIISQYGRYGKLTEDGDGEAMHDRRVLEMLSKLPIGIVRPMVENATRSVADEYDKKRLARLLGEL